jgi:hypothetical protein
MALFDDGYDPLRSSLKLNLTPVLQPRFFTAIPFF